MASAALGNAFLRLYFIGANFLAVLVLARSMEVAEYGRLSYLLALVAFLALAAQFGFPSYLTRHISAARAQEQQERLYSAFRLGFSAGLWGLLISCAVLAVILFSQPQLMADQPFLGGLSAVILASTLVMMVSASILRGHGQVTLAMVPENFAKPTVVLLSVFALSVLLQEQLDLATAMGIYVVASVSAALFGTLAVVPLLRNAVQHADPEFRLHGWSQEVFPLGFTVLVQAARAYIAILLLGLMAPPESVAQFRVALQFAIIVSFSLQVLNTVLAPHFSKHHALKNSAAISGLVNKSRLVALGIGVPAFLVLLFVGEPMLVLLLGPAYAAAHEPLVWLAAGELFGALVGPLGLLLNMSGNSQSVFRATTVSLVTVCAGCVVLVPGFGVVGAAIATCASMVLINIQFMVATRSRLG